MICYLKIVIIFWGCIKSDTVLAFFTAKYTSFPQMRHSFTVFILIFIIYKPFKPKQCFYMLL